MRSKTVSTFVLALACLSASAIADVKLPGIFGDHMVLQRDQKVPFWGTADAGEQVTVTIGAAKATATADADGNWKAVLEPLKASEEAADVVVAGKNTITIKDVLVGDVWVCSGQSNMGYTLDQAHNVAQAKKDANRPNLRLFTVGRKVAFEPQTDCKGAWAASTPETAVKFSAVAYFFGVEIQADQKVPIGLINTSWGGTPAQAWTSLEVLQATPATKTLADQFVDTKTNLDAKKEKYTKEVLPDWEAKQKAWQDEVAKLKAEKVDASKLPKGPGQKPYAPDQNPNLSTVLYNGMIAPIIPLSIKGAIWYQGESNAGQPGQYRDLFPAMITDWRTRWGQGDFPFCWVQLANYMARETEPQPHAGGWAGLREAQSMTLKLPNTGQAVIIDIGEDKDIHPKNKLDVGKRLALAARHAAYGQTLVYSGPTYASMAVEGDKIRVKFDNVGGGLIIGAAPPIRMDQKPADPLAELKGFAIAGADRKFVWADAKIDGDSIIVFSPNVKDPAMVHYAWGNNPECNLYNKEGLPANPFRTEPDAPKAAK